MQRGLQRVRTVSAGRLSRITAGRGARRLGLALLVLAVIGGAAAYATSRSNDAGILGTEAPERDGGGAVGIAVPPSGVMEDRAGGGALAFPAKEADESARSAAAPGSPPSPGGAAAQALGRDIIRSGSMELEVDSVAGAFSRVSAIAASAGGLVADSTFYGDGDKQYAQMTLRVPAERFDAVVEELRGVAAEVRSLSTSSQDVTGEVTDLRSQLRNLRAVEARYLELLSQAEQIADILQVQDRINQVRMEIEQTEGRIEMLARLTEMATLSVSLSPVDAVPADAAGESGLRQSAREAWQASLGTLEALATVLVVAVVYSWWLLPLLVLALLAARRLWRGPAQPPRPVE